MNKMMVSVAIVIATASSAYAGNNEGGKPAKKRLSSAAIARIYDSTWKMPVPMPNAPANGKVEALYEKSFGPMDAVAALPSVVPVFAPAISSVAPVLPSVIPPVMPSLASIEDELEVVAYTREDTILVEQYGDPRGAYAAKDTTHVAPDSVVVPTYSLPTESTTAVRKAVGE